VECGATGPLVGALCERCFRARQRFAAVPDHTVVVLCAECGALQEGSEWVDLPSPSAAMERAAKVAVQFDPGAVGQTISVALERLDERNYRAAIAASGTLQGLSFSESLSSELRLRSGLCPTCSRRRGQYYESILQVRAAGRELSPPERRELRAAVQARVSALRAENRNQFLTKIEEVPGGLDFYLGTASLGRRLLKELHGSLGGETKESSALWGQKDGKEVYRMTYLLRLPAYRVGDVLKEGAEHLWVRRITPEEVTVVVLERGERTPRRHADLGSLQVVGGMADLREAVVVAQSEEELQVLDPLTYRTVELRKPPGLRAEGPTVHVFRLGDDLLPIDERW